MKSKVFSILAMTIFVSICFAGQDVEFEATVDMNAVALGERVQLSLIFRGQTNISAPDIPQPEGFSAQYLGPSTMVSYVNGKMSSSISHNYILVSLKTGKFRIGPYYIDYNGQKYVSQPIDVEVTDQPASQRPSTQNQRPQAGEDSIDAQLKDRIFVELEAAKLDAYINELIPVTARLYVNRLDIRNIQMPPALTAEGFSKGQFGQAAQYQRVLAGLEYQVVEVKTYVYALKTGSLALGPVQFDCDLAVRRQAQRNRPVSPFDDFFGNDDFFNDFFSRYESYPLHLKSSQLAISIKPLPEENKPADSSGAVGDFDVQIEADQLKVKAGDPITLRIKVSGEGNFATVNAPAMEDTAGFKIYQPQAKTEGNQKIFEQVIIPLSEKVAYIPAVSFSFFNPKAQSYQMIKRGPIAITVSKPEESGLLAKSKLVEAAQPAAAGGQQAMLQENEENLGRDIIYIKDRPGPLKRRGEFLYRGKRFIFSVVLPALIYLVLFYVIICKKEV